MKVLFAVSNEEISESIVKKYQKEYKQIISYKNVYYFNAILKELQKDKTYDRVVISEDLEAFTHTQYDQIDKFIFEKLDSISDEASNTRGNDIPIILICSDRRAKSEEMLVKLFGIGVYNAIIGSDRSVDEVCRLINRPRSKKDAKIYYKIDSENVNYQSENENDVSEMEIQNILAHYKRLGKNEDRYIDSFNNIAAQYNDTQLRIISKFLPLNVRAVLEEKSPKYQQIMSFNNSVSDTLRKPKKEVKEGPSETLLVSKTKDRIMSRPVVIPSSINMNSTKKLARVKAPEQPVKLNKNTNESYGEPVQPTQQPSAQTTTQQEAIQFETYDMQSQQLPVEPVKRGRGRPRKNPIPTTEEPVVTTKRKRGRPRKNPIPEESAPMIPMETEEEEPTILPGFEEPQETIIPGFEQSQETTLPGVSSESTQEEPERIESGFLPGFDYEEPSKSEEVFTSGTTRENEFYHNQNQPNTQYGVQKNQDTILPGFESHQGFEREPQQEQEIIDLSPLLTPDKKIVTFVGTSKNGTSFIVNNLAQLLSSNGVNTAILDTTQNRNSYYIYTKNEEELREIATHSMDSLANGVARGIMVNKNLTVYTSLPNEGEAINNVSKVLETLLKNHSLILIDTDFRTPLGYFEQSQETYLVQTLDILTIQPLTAFLRELKSRNILNEKKLRVILNKTVKIRGITDKTIIGGMAYYNDPAMSFMTELFDRNLMRYVSIPFEEETYTKYLENIIECEISLKGYSKVFMQTLKELSNMVYPLTNTYRPPTASGYGRNNNFTPSINKTLNQMKNNY